MSIAPGEFLTRRRRRSRVPLRFTPGWYACGVFPRSHLLKSLNCRVFLRETETKRRPILGAPLRGAVGSTHPSSRVPVVSVLKALAVLVNRRAAISDSRSTERKNSDARPRRFCARRRCWDLIQGVAQLVWPNVDLFARFQFSPAKPKRRRDENLCS